MVLGILGLSGYGFNHSLIEPSSSVVVFQSNEYGSVLSVTPVVTPFTHNSTLSTPSLSDDIQLIETITETVEPSCGEVMVTVGGVVSTSSGCSSSQPQKSKIIQIIMGRVFSFYSHQVTQI